MQQVFIGRKEELKILDKALQSEEPEMVAVIGRRRVGKTFMIREACKQSIDFELTGVQNGTSRQQLQNFADRLTFHAKPLFPFQRPSNWFQAFQLPCSGKPPRPINRFF
jgi:AAA+ ATPase superfamily predicted ATPase